MNLHHTAVQTCNAYNILLHINMYKFVLEQGRLKKKSFKKSENVFFSCDFIVLFTLIEK